MTPKFHMPIRRGQIFDSGTKAAIDDFLNSAPRMENGDRLCAIVVDFMVHHRENELVSMDARLRFYGESEAGDMQQHDPKQFTGELTARYATLAAAITTDDVAVQNIGMEDYLPWRDMALRDAMLGEIFTCVQGVDFALLGAEYPPSDLADNAQVIMGPNAEDARRRSLMLLLLPPAASAHQAMEQMTGFGEISRLVDLIWMTRLDGMGDDYPLAELEPPSWSDA